MKRSTQSQHVLGEKNKTSTHTFLQNDDCWGAHCWGRLGPQDSGVRAGRGVLAAAFQAGSPHPAGHCPLEATESGLQLREKGTWPRLEIRISYRQTPKVCVNRIISQLRPLQMRKLRPGRLNELPGFLCRTGPGTQVS